MPVKPTSRRLRNEVRRRSRALLHFATEMGECDVLADVSAASRDRDPMLDGRKKSIAAPAIPEWERVRRRRRGSDSRPARSTRRRRGRPLGLGRSYGGRLSAPSAIGRQDRSYSAASRGPRDAAETAAEFSRRPSGSIAARIHGVARCLVDATALRPSWVTAIPRILSETTGSGFALEAPDGLAARQDESRPADVTRRAVSQDRFLLGACVRRCDRDRAIDGVPGPIGFQVLAAFRARSGVESPTSEGPLASSPVRCRGVRALDRTLTWVGTKSSGGGAGARGNERRPTDRARAARRAA